MVSRMKFLRVISFINSILFISLVFSLFLLSGCGKHETSSGAVGAASGAIVGNAVSGEKNKGTGTILGAVIGNYLGRKIGRQEDRRENEEDAQEKREMHALKEENRYLKKSLKKWCDNCNRRISIVGANSCPHCGSQLIKEKFCKKCTTLFNPECSYRYCPYCRHNVRLSCR